MSAASDVRVEVEHPALPSDQEWACTLVEAPPSPGKTRRYRRGCRACCVMFLAHARDPRHTFHPVNSDNKIDDRAHRVYDVSEAEWWFMHPQQDEPA